MKPSEILRQARQRIENPARWCQGIWARTADGYAAVMAMYGRAIRLAEGDGQ
jgi:hypothetical protein